MERMGYISIHAPLAGCDTIALIRPLVGFHFNPRTPCGVRPEEPRSMADMLTFQSTHPLRGATARYLVSFSIRRNFNPRTPCGVRHELNARHFLRNSFQSTHPLRGATLRVRAIL